MARFGELNLAFHQALIALAKSPMLQLSLDRVQSIAFASPAAVVTPAEPGGFAQAIREHEAILDAIQAGDAVRAEKLVREHARFALRGVKNAIDRPRPRRKSKSRRVKRSLRGKIHSARGPAMPKRPAPRLSWYSMRLRRLFCEKGFSGTTTRRDRSTPEYSSGIALLPRLRERGTAVSHQQTYSRSRGAAGRRGTPTPVETGATCLSAFIRGHLQGLFENPNRALASISEFRSLSRSPPGADRNYAGSYSDLLNRELASAVKAGILRQDIPVSILRLALFNFLNWTPRWYQPSGRLTLDDLAGIYDRVFFEGIVTPGHGRPSLPQLQNLSRRRSGSTLSGTLGKFVRTAAELFSKQGYASTTTRSLSALIGMEKATLYYHVKGKEDLLYLITKSSVETLQDEVEKAVEGITCPLEHLAVLIRAHCMSLLRDQTQHATSLAEVRALSPERLAEIVSLRKTYQTGIRRIIEAGQKNGSIRGDVEPRYLTSMLRGLLDRTVEWYQKGGSLAPAEVADYFCDIYLFGARKISAVHGSS